MSPSGAPSLWSLHLTEPTGDSLLRCHLRPGAEGAARLSALPPPDLERSSATIQAGSLQAPGVRWSVSPSIYLFLRTGMPLGSH